MDDEIVALEAIYGDSYSFDSDSDSHRIVINDLCSLEFWADRDTYPFAMPPEYTLTLEKGVAWKERDSSQKLHEELVSLFEPGEVCLFTWIEFLTANAE
ncbi:UNVERIFIED_CONTAM: hypothetical protein HDU68_001578, partial [Siphonaria sp. JEL0065]